jgi:hypothetical protein
LGEGLTKIYVPFVDVTSARNPLSPIGGRRRILHAGVAADGYNQAHSDDPARPGAGCQTRAAAAGGSDLVRGRLGRGHKVLQGLPGFVHQ